jgi:hypothetical protein
MKQTQRIGSLGLDLGSELLDFVKNVAVNYQAKIGTFLTYPQTLQGLKTRLVALSPTPYVNQAALMINEVDSAIANQNNLQTQGVDAIGLMNQIKTDPLIIDAINGKYPQWYELDKIQRVTDFINRAGTVKNIMSSLMDSVDRQTNIVNDLEKRVTNLEVSAGVKSKLAILANVPTAVWITLGVIGLKAGAGFFFKRGRK